MTHLANRLTVGLLGLSALLPPQVTATDNENHGVYFFKKAYMDQPLPEYATSKDYLPSPVFVTDRGHDRIEVPPGLGLQGR